MDSVLPFVVVEFPQALNINASAVAERMIAFFILILIIKLLVIVMCFQVFSFRPDSFHVNEHGSVMSCYGNGNCRTDEQ